MNNELKFPPNFERLVLGCIDAEFCKQILVGKLLTRSTRFTFMRLWEKRTDLHTSAPLRSQNVSQISSTSFRE